MNNPMNILKTFFNGGGNPKDLVMKAMLGNNSNAMINNLVNMAKNGNSQGIEEFARNFFKEKGRDFDKEFADFMQNINS